MMRPAQTCARGSWIIMIAAIMTLMSIWNM